MEPLQIVIFTLVALIMLGLGFFIGYIFRIKQHDGGLKKSEEEKKSIIEEGRKEAEKAKKESILETKQEIHNLKKDADKEIKERKSL